VGEFDLVAARQEAVEDGGDLTLKHQFAVDELDFLLGGLRGPDATTFLLALGGGSVVRYLFVKLVIVPVASSAQSCLRVPPIRISVMVVVITVVVVVMMIMVVIVVVVIIVIMVVMVVIVMVVRLHIITIGTEDIVVVISIERY